MSSAIIKVDLLSKRYTLGQYTAHTLRDEVKHFLRRRRAVGQTAPFMDATDFWALRDVSFDVQPGEVLGIIGRNGAGKSTLLKILSRITEPTSGEARIRGRVASLLEVGTGFHPELTGRENIFLNGTFLGMSHAEVKDKFDEIVSFADIEKFLDTPVKRYSSGMYIRLAFAVAAHLEPEVLIVDEVLAVGDAEFQQKCLGKMKEVSGKGGRTVLFVSHNIGAVRELCSRAILMEAGRIKADGSTSSVVEAYQSGATAQRAVVDLTALKQFGPRACCKLHALHLLTVAAQPTTTFTMNEPLVARILLETTTPVRRLEVGLKISSRFGVPIHYFTSSWEGLSPNLDVGFHWFEVRVPALLVFPGTYLLGLWASKPSEASDVNAQDVTKIEVLSANFTRHPHRMTEYVVSGSEVYASSEWKLLAADPKWSDE